MLKGDETQGEGLAVMTLGGRGAEGVAQVYGHAAGRHRINVTAVVGGLSETKQERLLARKPEVCAPATWFC
jgi:hypothetical protein